MKKLLSLLTLMVVLVVQASAQPLPPPPPNTAIPLDVIVSVLVVASLIYGAIKLSRNKPVKA